MFLAEVCVCVCHPAIPPQIVQFPDDMKILAGEKVEILCKFGGAPPIKCTWLKFRKPVRTSLYQSAPLCIDYVLTLLLCPVYDQLQPSPEMNHHVQFLIISVYIFNNTVVTLCNCFSESFLLRDMTDLFYGGFVCRSKRSKVI